MKTLQDTGSKSPKYVRLAKFFRDQVMSGTIKPGDRLPSFAQMQAEHGIGQGTLERVYALLEKEHLIVREPKRGTFVAPPCGRPIHNIVAVAFGRIPNHPYYSALFQGIHPLAYDEQVEIMVVQDSARFDWNKVDGVLSGGCTEHVPLFLPVVSLLQPVGSAPCVLADDYEGALTAARHLVELGHRRIASLLLAVRRPFNYLPQQRLSGYHAALTEAGIKPLRAWQRPLRDSWQPMTGFSEFGYEKMSRWLREDWAELGCTAIVAHNDDTAIGIIRAFREVGIRVPGDVSVVGFDGTELGEHVRPSLTTVAVPLREVGARALSLLLQQVRSGEAPARGRGRGPAEVLPTRLIVRESTAPNPHA